MNLKLFCEDSPVPAFVLAPVADVAPLPAPGVAPSPAPLLPALSSPAAAAADAAVAAPASGVAPPPAPVVPPPPVAPVALPVAAPVASLGAPGGGSALPLPVAPSSAPVLSPAAQQRNSRPHTPSSRDERDVSRRRRDSPRRRQPQANWHAHQNGWGGGRGRGRGGAFDGPVTMADLQRVVTAVMREERALQANQQFPRASAAPPPVAPPVTAPAAVAHHLPAPPAPYPSLLPGDSAPHAAGAAQPFQSFVGPPRAAEMYGHAGFSRGNSLDNGSRDECLDATDRLAELLAPVLAAPARGGVAGVGQLGTAVRGLRRFSRAGTAADVIGASTAVVRELHRSLTGLLAVLDADQM
ncbi:unnamed protein product [Closterium sp. Naga37s-1]|nr:unnamed protein product [Closterium sp. Naga37s-1]